MVLVILAGVCFVTGVLITPFKLSQSMIGTAPRLLPSTLFAACAALAITGVPLSNAETITFWGLVAGLSGGFLGTVASVFSMRIIPRWQWMTQLVASALVLAVVGAHLVILF